MMRRLFSFSVAVVTSAAGWVACVGDEPVTRTAGDGGESEGSVDAGADTSTAPDVGADAGVDAADAADAACVVPGAGAGLSCTPTQTCPRGETCCTKLNGLRGCVAAATDCMAAAAPVQCAARAHCADGAEVCCLETNPAGTLPAGSCPATVRAFGTACSLPASDAGACPGSGRRLCDTSETCPSGTTCRQISVDIGTATPLVTGACL